MPHAPKLSVYFFAAVFLFLLYQLFIILSPFFAPILLSVMVVLVFYPLHRLCQHLLKGRKTLAALISVTGVLIVIVGPLAFLGWTLTSEVAKIIPRAQEFVQGSWPLFEKIESFFLDYHIDLQAAFLNIAKGFSDFLVQAARKALQNTLFLFVHMGVFIVVTFFFFRDGDLFLRRFEELVPMETQNKRLIAERFSETVVSIIRTLFVIAIVQGIGMGIAFWILGVTAPVTLALITAILACIPFAGPPILWIPIAALLFMEEQYVHALILVGWGMIVVGSADNLLRPILIGRGSQLPFIWLFLGILGGLRVYGIAGILIGPLLVAIVFAFVRIYQEKYLRI